MDELQKKLLRVVIAEFAKLPETEKLGGVENRAAAKLMAKELQIDPSFVDSPDYRGSDAFSAIWRLGQELDEAGLIEADGRASGTAWLKPTERGRMLVEQLQQDENSPAVQGRRIVRWVYEKQQDLSEVHRKVGKGGQLDVDRICAQLDFDRKMYERGARWAMRQGYIDEPSIDQYSVDSGGVYITDEGMTAVDNDFKTEQSAAGATINIHDSQVYGNVLATGRDAMTITSPALAGDASEIRSLLGEIQDAVETLSDDDRHDALQELESVQREFLKKEPLRERIERSISVLGGLASMSTLAGQHLTRLLELAQQLPGT